jgi:hypothetical protein
MFPLCARTVAFIVEQPKLSVQVIQLPSNAITYVTKRPINVFHARIGAQKAIDRPSVCISSIFVFSNKVIPVTATPQLFLNVALEGQRDALGERSRIANLTKAAILAIMSKRH